MVTATVRRLLTVSEFIIYEAYRSSRYFYVAISLSIFSDAIFVMQMQSTYLTERNCQLFNFNRSTELGNQKSNDS